MKIDKKFSRETKDSAVNEYFSTNYTLDEVAKKYGMSRSLLHKEVQKRVASTRDQIDDDVLVSEIKAITSIVDILRGRNNMSKDRIIQYVYSYLEGEEEYGVFDKN